MTAREPISQPALAQLFTDARSHHHWTDKKMSDESLRTLYELIKWGPTRGNLQPARIVFVRSEAGRLKLYPALEGMGSNPAQVQAAPRDGHRRPGHKVLRGSPAALPPHGPETDVQGRPAFAESIGYRSSSLTGA